MVEPQSARVAATLEPLQNSDGGRTIQIFSRTVRKAGCGAGATVVRLICAPTSSGPFLKFILLNVCIESVSFPSIPSPTLSSAPMRCHHFRWRLWVRLLVRSVSVHDGDFGKGGAGGGGAVDLSSAIAGEGIIITITVAPTTRVAVCVCVCERERERETDGASRWD